jgi:predicted RNA binding protein YcfA (HicA-like mRNA interferase family)
MKLPRNISANDLISSLQKFGYTVTRQKGSHFRVTTAIYGQHHLTIPNHSPIKIGHHRRFSMMWPYILICLRMKL